MDKVIQTSLEASQERVLSHDWINPGYPSVSDAYEKLNLKNVTKIYISVSQGQCNDLNLEDGVTQSIVILPRPLLSADKNRPQFPT